MKTKLIIFDLDDTLYDTSNRLDAVTPNFAEMKLFPNVREILENIKTKKILLTQGNDVIQNKKIDTLDIRHLFDEIIIVSKSVEKNEAMVKIREDYINPDVVLVVGDRRDAEIRYGNQAGFVTALLPGFKYKDLVPQDDLEVPNFEINELVDILTLL